MGRGKTIRELIKSFPQNCFWVYNGPILSDLKELRDSLKREITDEQFSYHVTEDRNDFADWIGETLKDGHCATEVRSAKKRSTVISRIEECLKRYK